jgi:hypothetical protein
MIKRSILIIYILLILYFCVLNVQHVQHILVITHSNAEKFEMRIRTENKPIWYFNEEKKVEDKVTSLMYHKTNYTQVITYSILITIVMMSLYKMTDIDKKKKKEIIQYKNQNINDDF